MTRLSSPIEEPHKGTLTEARRVLDGCILFAGLSAEERAALHSFKNVIAVDDLQLPGFYDVHMTPHLTLLK